MEEEGNKFLSTASRSSLRST